MKSYDQSTGLWRFVKTDTAPARSLETIEKSLRKLGLSRNEVRVYIHAARTGEHKASEISEALSLHRTETYRILRDLEKKGLVSSVFEKPLKFLATPFERALDTLIETRKIKINLLERRKDGLVDIWLSLPKSEVEIERKEVFQILEGEEQISLRADELLGNAEKEVLVFASEQDIGSLYHSSLFDNLHKTTKRNINVQLLTNSSPKTCFLVEKIKLRAKCLLSNVEEIPTFILVDNSHLLLLVGKGNSKKKVAALWTNYDAFVKALKALFLELWTRNN